MLIGVDIGTTAVKVLAIDESGRVLGHSRHIYGFRTAPGGLAVQKPRQLWDTVALAVRECVAGIGGSPAAISLSSQGGSLVCLGTDGSALSDVELWMDARSLPQRNKLSQLLGENSVYHKTGWKLDAGLNLCKLQRIREEEPQVFENTAKFLSVIDYIQYNLTGMFAIDPSSAAMTQLYDIRRERWDNDLLCTLELDESRLPELRRSCDPIGHLTREAAEKTGLPRETVVYSGGHDQYCAAAGCGALDPGQFLISTGTAWAVIALTDHPLFDDVSFLSPGPHVAEGLWGAMAALSCGGASLEWLRGSGFGAEAPGLQAIDAIAATRVNNGSRLFFYPYFDGSGFPDYSTQACGTLLGLALCHDFYDMALAVMEGVAFQTRTALEAFGPARSGSGKIRIIGGAASSGLWMDILANVLDEDITLMMGENAACMGAALIAGVGCGAFTSLKAGAAALSPQGRDVTGDERLTAYYHSKYEAYRRGMSSVFDFYEGTGGRYADGKLV